MSDYDSLVQTIDAIYESGVDNDRVTAALEAMGRQFHAVGTMLFEVVDATAQMPTEFWSYGLPALKSASYVEQFVSLNPRIAFAFHQNKEQIIWDYQLIDEDRMEHHPFYADFLPSLGLRYTLAAVLERTSDKLVIISTHRTRQQGHVNEHEIALMRRLFPHLQRSHDMAKRLKIAGIRQGVLENTLDWLNDGVALLRRDGRVIYANETLCGLERRGDAFRIANDIFEFFSAETHARFMTAFEAVIPAYSDLVRDTRPMEFPAPRSDGSPAYTVALRPIIQGQAYPLQHADAAVMMFVHDPLARNAAVSQMLAELFNLTRAEANLAQALSAGMTTGTYASTRRISLNTVYTHLRRLREKTQCNSIAELMRKFSELKVPLRLDKSNFLPRFPSEHPASRRFHQVSTAPDYLPR